MGLGTREFGGVVGSDGSRKSKDMATVHVFEATRLVEFQLPRRHA